MKKIILLTSAALILSDCWIDKAKADEVSYCNDNTCGVIRDSCGASCTWSIENGVLTISGSNEMYDYGYDYSLFGAYIDDRETFFLPPWYGEDYTSVVISGLSYIGQQAFEGENIENVTLGESVSTIGSGAFIDAHINDLNCIGSETACTQIKSAMKSAGEAVFTDSQFHTITAPIENCGGYNQGVCNFCKSDYALGGGSCHACGTGKNCHWDETDEKVVFDSCKSNYLRKENECVSSLQGCGANFRLNDGECDRIRYTPAEAAAIARDGDTNIVTITFKK